MLDIVIMSNKDMAQGKDRMPNEMETCDVIISLNQTDNNSEWEVINDCEYIYFIFCGPDE